MWYEKNPHGAIVSIYGVPCSMFEESKQEEEECNHNNRERSNWLILLGVVVCVVCDKFVVPRWKESLLMYQCTLMKNYQVIIFWGEWKGARRRWWPWRWKGATAWFNWHSNWCWGDKALMLLLKPGQWSCLQKNDSRELNNLSAINIMVLNPHNPIV